MYSKMIFNTDISKSVLKYVCVIWNLEKKKQFVFQRFICFQMCWLILGLNL